MSSRIDNVMINTADVWSIMSKCKRRKVGAVIGIDNRIISCGYNGTVSGTCNDCEVKCVDCDGVGSVKGVCVTDKDVSASEYMCATCDGVGLVTSDKTIHAEENAIVFCAKEGISTKGATIYVTLSPCSKCARMIAQAGIERVVYRDVYSDIESLDILLESGVVVTKIK